MELNLENTDYAVGQRVRVDDGETVEFGTIRGIPQLRQGEVLTLDIEFDSGVWCETPARFVR